MARKKKPVKFLSLDTETIGLAGALKRIAVYDGKKVSYGYTFLDVEPVLIDYYEQGFDVVVWIHNLEFDARKIPEIFDATRIDWERTKLINKKYAVIQCKQYSFHDSFKILPESLAKLSKSFDLEHGKLDLWDAVQKEYPGQYKNHVDFLNRCDKDDKLYLTYLGYDVMSLYELMYKLMEVAGLDEREMSERISTASLSKYIFKHGYKGKQFKNPNLKKTDYQLLCTNKQWHSDNPVRGNLSDETMTFRELEELIRLAYCGGRTEVFIPYVGNVSRETICAWHFDVNSLYPYVMLRDVPIGMPQFYSDDIIVRTKFERWMEDHQGLGFITAHVYIPEQFIPPLPVHLGKLCFTTGHAYGVWTYNELEYAIKECGVTVVEYVDMTHFTRTYPVFKNFIETFSQMKTEAKEKGEQALTKFTKLVQNTGYGYTGMTRDDKTELHVLTEENKKKYADVTVSINEELGYIEVQSDVDSESIQVQVAAYITSYARLELLKMAHLQIKRGGNVYYCDTDSLVTDIPLLPEYVHGSKLGFWDMEGEIYEGIFIQPKVYFESKPDDDTIKFKGVSKSTQQNFRRDFYMELLEDLRAGSTEEKTVEEGKELLRSIQYTQKRGIDMNTVEYRDKKMRLANTQKRQMDYANNTSKPWHFNTLEEFEDFHF